MKVEIAKWVAFTGADGQIAEMRDAPDGWICRFRSGFESDVHYGVPAMHVCGSDIVAYLLCKPHPLKDTIIRQATTGQPLYWRSRATDRHGECPTDAVLVLATDFEYSFTPFS